MRTQPGVMDFLRKDLDLKRSTKKVFDSFLAKQLPGLRNRRVVENLKYGMDKMRKKAEGRPMPGGNLADKMTIVESMLTKKEFVRAKVTLAESCPIVIAYDDWTQKFIRKRLSNTGRYPFICGMDKTYNVTNC